MVRTHLQAVKRSVGVGREFEEIGGKEMSESKFKISETVKFNGERMKIIGIRSVNWGAKYVYELLRDQDGNVDHDWNIKGDEIEKLEWDLKKVPEDNRSEFLKNLSSKDDDTELYKKYIEQKQLVDKLLKANLEVVEALEKRTLEKKELGEENENLKGDLAYQTNNAEGFEEHYHILDKENADLKEQLSKQREINKALGDENDAVIEESESRYDRLDDLEERVKIAIEIGKKEREEKIMYKAAWENAKRELNNLKFAMKHEDHYYDILKTFLSH